MSTVRSPTMEQVLGIVLSRRLNDVHTAMPGTVESFDVAKQTANVKLLLKDRQPQEDGTTADVSHPIAVNVPLVFPGAGDFRITFPLKKGDGVLVVFAEASIDRWQALGGEQAVDGRRFHIADAIAIPGLNPSTVTRAGFAGDALTIGANAGPGIVMRSSTVELGARSDQAATQPVLLGADTTAALDALLTDLLTQLAACVTALGVAATGLGAATVANAIPIVGGALASPGFATATTQLGTMAAQLGAMITTVTTLKTKLPTLHSQIVKTR